MKANKKLKLKFPNSKINHIFPFLIKKTFLKLVKSEKLVTKRFFLCGNEYKNAGVFLVIIEM